MFRPVLLDLVAADPRRLTSDVPHGKLREVIEKQFLSTVFDDLQIWRYQKYVENPALSKSRRERVYGTA